jgi:hypothetical protein
MRFAAVALLSLSAVVQPAGAHQAAGAPPAAAQAQSQPDTQAATQAATEAVTQWLVLTDGGKHADGWSQAATAFRGAVTQPQWEGAMQAVRTPLGAVKSRKLASAQYTRSLPGAPAGEYVLVQYQTDFANKAGVVETVVPMREADGSWKVSGYAVR